MEDFKIPSSESIIEHAKDMFQKHFKLDPDICACAPGRVNLIGEHVDYNDGFVLPMALPMVTVIVGKKTSEEWCHIVTSCPSADDPKEIQFQILDGGSRVVLEPGKPLWANYVKGVIANFKGALCGFKALVATSVPVGGGLSSSAALEVATFTLLEGLTTSKLSVPEKALACQKAEHEFCGTPCGIMDQFISFMGKKDHLLLLDCRSLKCEWVSLESPDVSILITNTNVHHNLSESEYSTRRKQCERAAKILGLKSLRDISLKELQERKDELQDELYKRAVHVVTEIQRTVLSSRAVQEGNYAALGVLMQQSHKSLRDDYEVSCPELDTVVEAALSVEGVLGSRMTGGGFGGCTVTLLKSHAVHKTVNKIKEKYKKSPTFYVCRPADGAQLMLL